MTNEQPTDKFLMRALSIVENLYQRTLEGNINWEQSSVSARGFQAELGDLKLTIQELYDPQYPDQPDYNLDIYRAQSSQHVETISNQTLRPLLDRTNERGMNPYSVLRETYQMARRKTLKVDDALDDLLEQLTKPCLR